MLLGRDKDSYRIIVPPTDHARKGLVATFYTMRQIGSSKKYGTYLGRNSEQEYGAPSGGISVERGPA